MGVIESRNSMFHLPSIIESTVATTSFQLMVDGLTLWPRNSIRVRHYDVKDSKHCPINMVINQTKLIRSQNEHSAISGFTSCCILRASGPAYMKRFNVAHYIDTTIKPYPLKTGNVYHDI